MVERFEPNLAARLVLGRREGFPTRNIFPVSSTVTFVRRDGTIWRWELSLSSFERVHGMSRVVKLVPDKLRTAAAINAENLKDPKDDGSFLVDLVVNLVKFYVGQSEKKKDGETRDLEERNSKRACGEEPTAAEFQMGHYVPSEEEGQVGLDFEGTLLTLWLGLSQFRGYLKKRVGSATLRAADRELVDFSADLLACCHAYMDFLHPVWIEVQRSGNQPAEETAEALRFKATSKIEGCPSRLKLEDCDDNAGF